MNFLAQKLNGLRQRWRFFRFGILYARSGDFRIPDKLWINRRFRPLRFENVSAGSFRYEFTEICINDCYRLEELAQQLGRVRSVVDIGANQGLFLVAARKTFPGAAISCYEPNPRLTETLGFNAAALNVDHYSEAVTRENCMVDLNFFDSDLYTRTAVSSAGQITGTSFREVIQRQGGTIDVLKLDCEGGEWPLFEDKASWEAVMSITMEYHLWARESYTAMDLIEQLKNLGFDTVLAHQPQSEQFGLITVIRTNAGSRR